MQIALLADPHLSLLPENAEARQFANSAQIVAGAIDELNERRPDLAIWLGDLTHEGTPQVRALWRELSAGLTVPILQIVGNHDVELVTKAQFGKQIPIVQRCWLTLERWHVLIIDTVRQLQPDSPRGQLTEVGLAMLRAAVVTANADRNGLLVMGHHPMREPELPDDDFFAAVEGLHNSGVYIGAHSHVNRLDGRNGWHLVELAGLCMYPLEYHWLTLDGARLDLQHIRPEIEALRRQARDELEARGGPEAIDRYVGPPEAQHIRVDAAEHAG